MNSEPVAAEERLRALIPAGVTIDREKLLYLAGSRAAGSQARRACRIWRLSTAVSVMVILGLMAVVLPHLQDDPRHISSASRPVPSYQQDDMLGAEGHAHSDVERGGDRQARHVPSAHLAGWTEPSVRFAFASNASVIVGTGRTAPVQLGAYVPYSQYGDTLHVWDWSTSASSRAMEDVRLWEHQRFALSPDGRLLVWSTGDILDIETRKRRTIDLGGAYHVKRRDDKLRRIRDMQFSPDGGRLALLVARIDQQASPHPLRKHEIVIREIIQVVEFPSGKLLCEFPSGDTSTLRIAFSPDGKRIVSKTPAGQLEQQIVEHDATTGEILREYEPRVKGHAYAIALSPDSALLAVFDGARGLLLWETASGDLKHTVEKVRHASYSTALRFSPNSKYIALDSTHKVFVVDVTTGEIVATVPQSNAEEIQWSRDGEKITVVTGPAYGDGNRLVPMYNIYPAVYQWEWRSAMLVRSMASTPPTDDSGSD